MFFNTCIDLMLTLEAKVRHAIDALDAFDAKLIIFQNNMWEKNIKVIKKILQFLQAYDS
jgi:hypothetical protein